MSLRGLALLVAATAGSVADGSAADGGVPPKIVLHRMECNLRELAFNWAQTLLPEAAGAAERDELSIAVAREVVGFYADTPEQARDRRVDEPERRLRDSSVGQGVDRCAVCFWRE